MKTRFLPSALVLAIASASGLAQANPSSVEVTVKGTIKPAITCTPSVSANQIDYGDIAISSINKDKATVLAEKPLTLNVNCTDAAKFSVKLTDTKKASAVSDATFLSQVQQTLAGAATDHAFGLGTSGDGETAKNIGALFLKVNPESGITGDSATRRLVSNTNATDWVASTDHFLKESTAGSVYGFANVGTTDPIAIKQLAMGIGVVAAIDSKQLDFKNEVNLDGKFTIEITQL